MARCYFGANEERLGIRATTRSSTQLTVGATFAGEDDGADGAAAGNEDPGEEDDDEEDDDEEGDEEYDETLGTRGAAARWIVDAVAVPIDPSAFTTLATTVSHISFARVRPTDCSSPAGP